ncbi:hypothetical protein [Palleronia pelagia]|uniref:Uncharacterized protein n=1 Tax=Palleronia pelagia TaxID=387096 RepID=A0A1H8D7P8_9RHOB|nr:hypothetical protein [Palleronia pelagia]SEN03341.1 hypothetical protein SAMN04488011_102243 [Palleronia pelagia]
MLAALVLAGLAGAMALPDVLSVVKARGDDDASDDQSSPENDVVQAPEGGGDLLDYVAPRLSAPVGQDPARVGVATTLHVDVGSGTHLVENLVPGIDSVTLSLPDDVSALVLSPATEDADATLSWQQDGGTIALTFQGFETVPVDSVSVAFEGQAGAVSLSDLLAAQAEEAAIVTAPDTPSGSADAPAGDTPPVAPEDPETPATPPDPVDDPGQVVAPEDPEAPSRPDPGCDDYGVVLSPDEDPEDYLDSGPDDLPPSASVLRVSDFTPGDDLLRIETDAAGPLSLRPAPDGDGTMVFVGDSWVATVAGPQDGLSIDDIVIAPLSGQAA